MITIKRIIVLTATVCTALAFFSCSVVFTSSITGSIADNDEYENGDASSGIADAAVYLYTDETDCDADLAAWTADNAIIPDEPATGDPTYFLKTITDEDGDYKFNGFIWNDLFPEYGKSGDREEIFLLFYHKNYGLVKNPSPVYVVSDVTNDVPLFTFTKILNTAEIAGTVSDNATGEVLANATVNIWVPLSWSYLSDGSIDTDESSTAKFTWDDSASYTATTDDDGEWEQEISYKMLPSSVDNNGTVIIRLTYNAGSYIAENAADSEIIDGGWDRDANGTIESDEDDGYFQSSEIIKGTYTELGDIALADELNTATVSGSVVNSNTNAGVENVSVRIFVAEDWEYTSGDPDDIEAADDVEWPENPTYTVTTDADGEYSHDIEFERKPSETDNRGTTRVRLVFVKDNFRIDSTSDASLTDGGWDRDGNGTVDADEDDSYYDPAEVVTADLDNDLGTITIKQTDFEEDLSGEIWNSTGTTLVNGVEVWLFYAPVDHDSDPTTPMETPSPADGQEPDYIDTTSSEVITTDTVEKGHFSFTGLEWTDEGYTGNQSKVSYYLYLPTSDEKSAGEFDSANSGNLVNNYLTAGSANYVSLQQ